MPPAVVHYQRVAWDAALTVTRATQAGELISAWCRTAVETALGAEGAAEYDATCQVLADVEAADARLQEEEGRWRARFVDLLRPRPELTRSVAVEFNKIKAFLPH